MEPENTLNCPIFETRCLIGNGSRGKTGRKQIVFTDGRFSYYIYTRHIAFMRLSIRRPVLQSCIIRATIHAQHRAAHHQPMLMLSGNVCEWSTFNEVHATHFRMAAHTNNNVHVVDVDVIHVVIVKISTSKEQEVELEENGYKVVDANVNAGTMGPPIHVW